MWIRDEQFIRSCSSLGPERRALTPQRSKTILYCAIFYFLFQIGPNWFLRRRTSANYRHLLWPIARSSVVKLTQLLGNVFGRVGARRPARNGPSVQLGVFLFILSSFLQTSIIHCNNFSQRLWYFWVSFFRWHVLTSLANTVFPPTLSFLQTECTAALEFGLDLSSQLNDQSATGVLEVTSFLRILSALLEKHFLRTDLEKMYAVELTSMLSKLFSFLHPQKCYL